MVGLWTAGKLNVYNKLTMFSGLGRFAHKYKYFIVAGWVVLTAVLFLTAPKLSEVGITDQSQFLPQDTESARARDILDTKFANIDQSSSNALIVVYNESGLNQADMDRAESVRNWLISADAPEAVSRVISVFDNDALRSSLLSSDNTTMLITVDMKVPALDDAAQKAVAEIRAQLEQQSGTMFYLTGTVGLLNDLFDSVQNTISRTTIVTVILVIILLLIIYRSPVAALVPLVTIGISFLVAQGIVGFLAAAGLGVSTITDAYMVVTIFGVGTDYCLFIISRFREELHQKDRMHTIAFTMKRIGPIILASALTVVVAFLCLGISRFGMTRTSGWALAIGIIITLAAGLTLVPALMAIFGRFLFWPSMASPVHKQRKSGWSRIGKWVVDHPVVAAVPIIVFLVLPYFALPRMKLSANVLSQIPQEVESARGINIMRDHFPVGELSPLYLLIQSPDGSLLTSESLRNIEKVGQSLNSVDGVSRVDYFSTPSSQLISLGKQVGDIDIMSSDGLPVLTKLASIQSLLQSTSNHLTDLALRYPGVTQSPSFSGIIAVLTQLQTSLSQVDIASPADLIPLLPQLQQSMDNLSNALNTLGNEFALVGNTPFTDWLKTTYFSNDGKVTRINLVLSTDPFSDDSMPTVAAIREQATIAIDNLALTGTDSYLGGEAAVHSDMLATSEIDFTRVLIITSIGILAVIIILLRSLLAPLYMVLTVLFNFGATLGITTWLFMDVLKGANLIYMLPVFVFVMLAAVGADYNIFLVSRIREEAESKPIKEAVQNAVANTGGVITSCGIILAGTFATLATSSLPMVLQIGVPIATGVLIDTFLVRALLVPALARIAGRWSWWPSRLFRQAK